MSEDVVDAAEIEARSAVLYDRIDSIGSEQLQRDAFELMRATARAGANVPEPRDRDRLEAVLRFWAAYLDTALDLFVVPPALLDCVLAPSGHRRKVSKHTFRDALNGPDRFASRLIVHEPIFSGRLEKQSICDCVIHRGRLAGLEFGEETNLSRTGFVTCDMTGARVVVPAHHDDTGPPVLNAERAKFDTVDLSGTRFEHASFAKGAFLRIATGTAPAWFSNCDFNGVGFEDLERCEVTFAGNCTFRRASFQDCDLSGFVLEGCDLSNAAFSEANLAGMELRDCIVDGASFKRARGVEEIQTPGTDMSTAQLSREQRVALVPAESAPNVTRLDRRGLSAAGG